MDAKKEDMVVGGMVGGVFGGVFGGMVGGMLDDMDGMLGGMMDGHNPQSLLAKLAEGEQMEAALYTQIAQCVPSEELRRIILHKAMHERCSAKMLAMLSQHFGMMPADPPGMPMPYSVEGEKEKK